jgi:formyl-CoA transferase
LGHPSLAPHKGFEAKEGPFVICRGNDRLFAKLARELGMRNGARTTVSPPAEPA